MAFQIPPQSSPSSTPPSSLYGSANLPPKLSTPGAPPPKQFTSSPFSGNIPTQKSSPGALAFFWVSLIAMIIIIGGGIGLYIYNISLNSKIEKINIEIQDTQKNLNQKTIDNILTLDKQIRGIKSLLGNHIYTTGALKLIEDLTLPEVTWNGFDFNSADKKITLKATATGGFETAVRQILALVNDSRIADVTTSGTVNIDKDGKTSFDATIIVKDEVIKN